MYFQFYNLIPVLNAVENAALPITLDGVNEIVARDRSRAWIEKVGLAGRTTAVLINYRADSSNGWQLPGH